VVMNSPGFHFDRRGLNLYVQIGSKVGLLSERMYCFIREKVKLSFSEKNVLLKTQKLKNIMIEIKLLFCGVLNSPDTSVSLRQICTDCKTVAIQIEMTGLFKPSCTNKIFYSHFRTSGYYNELQKIRN
jgi:hypothetical protein